MADPSIDLLVQVLELRAKLGYATPPDTFTLLQRSAQANAIHFFRNGFGRPIGYVAWANVSPESLRLIRRQGRLPAYGYEWDEGRLTLLVDVAIRNDDAPHLRAHLREALRGKRCLAFHRRDRLSIYLRAATTFTLAHRTPRAADRA